MPKVLTLLVALGALVVVLGCADGGDDDDVADDDVADDDVADDDAADDDTGDDDTSDDDTSDDDVGDDDTAAADADGDGHDENVDCDDGDPLTFPGAPEQCDGIDNDCDGTVPANEVDGDADGSRMCDGDCNDSAGTTYPGAVEQCDGLDNDCDGAVPADESDGDGDGQRVCGGDCDDADPARGDGFAEVCDGLDNDCDGALPADELDSDGDAQRVCDGDCDDTDPARGDGFAEVCDGLDNDCDGVVPANEADMDGDGQRICAGDCDDTHPDVGDGFVELCDGLDNACAGAVAADELDADGDGQFVCEGDCDDSDPGVYWGGSEACDGVDTDCDPATDENADVDGDGYSMCDGDCDDADPGLDPADADGDGESSCDGDCDDTDASLNQLDWDLDGLSSCDGDCVDSPLELMEDALDASLDTEIAVEDASFLSGFAYCDIEVATSNAVTYLQYDAITVTPDAAGATVDLTIQTWVNTAWDPLHLDVDLDGFLCPTGGQSCDLYTDPTTVQVSYDVDLQVVDPGGGAPLILEATVAPPVHDCETVFTADLLHYDGCDLSDINDVLAFLGLDMMDLLLHEDLGILPCSLFEEEMADQIEALFEAAFDVSFAAQPGAVEVCDMLGVDGFPLEVDNDCDPTTSVAFDDDGDGWTTCGAVGAAPDCDDGDAAINPGVVEDGCALAADGLDNDCDGETDDDCTDWVIASPAFVWDTLEFTLLTGSAAYDSLVCGFIAAYLPPSGSELILLFDPTTGPVEPWFSARLGDGQYVGGTYVWDAAVAEPTDFSCDLVGDLFESSETIPWVSMEVPFFGALPLYDAYLFGEFAAAQTLIDDGVMTSALARSDASGITNPMNPSETLADLMDTYRSMDVDLDGDGVEDGWTLEMAFTAFAF